ncbi:MAG TPA: ribosome biogenesis GTP-binding protein YihA/YsxC [Candidatus Polarisedimenticolia bacterium]|nr:ribosome biogenesis GTP-binding protein YihA/YsxC [Candidatus Polarisedimenticolia bacterium]
MTGASRAAGFPRGGLPEVAFLGRSNVGKSSLLNTLVGRRLARVSRTPGRTQQAHFYSINAEILLVDLPGYGYARAPARVRAELASIIETYLESARPLALAVLIVDARHDPTELDRGMNEWIRSRDLPLQVVSTKMDKLSRQERHRSLERSRRLMGRDNIIPFSSETGEGKRELWQAIDSRTGQMSRTPPSPAGAPPR